MTLGLTLVGESNTTHFDAGEVDAATDVSPSSGHPAHTILRLRNGSTYRVQQNAMSIMEWVHDIRRLAEAPTS